MYRLSIGFLVLCTAFALAQNEDETFNELLNELDNQPAPAPGVLPPPAAATERPARANPPVAMSEEARNEAITRNYGETVEIYEHILQNQETNTQRLDQRINSLERMLEDYRPKYEQYATVVRGGETQLVQEANRLKADRRAGLMDEETYNRRLKEAEDRAKDSMSDAREQRDFYAEEIARAESTLVRLRQEREVLARNAELQRQADLASGKIKPPEPGYLQQILERHRKLGRINLEYPSDSFEFNLSVVRGLSSRH